MINTYFTVICIKAKMMFITESEFCIAPTKITWKNIVTIVKNQPNLSYCYFIQKLSKVSYCMFQ